MLSGCLVPSCCHFLEKKVITGACLCQISLFLTMGATPIHCDESVVLAVHKQTKCMQP